MELHLILPKIQLENETKMDKNFYYLLYFHFLNFLMKSSLDSTPTPTPTSGESFIDFLKKVNTNKKIKKKLFEEKIKSIIESNDLLNVLKQIKKFINNIQDKHKAENLNLGIREDDFEEEEIKKIKENLEIEEEDGEQNEEETNEEDFNINDQEGNAIILYFYSEFKNKKQIPPKSKDTLQIINYFTMNNMNKNLNEIKKEEEEKMKQKILNEQKHDKKIDNISLRLMNFCNEYKAQGVKQQNLPKLKQYINSSIGILKTSKLLYIPMLGVSNAGKSTILNGIIGCGILPARKNECTKKGILIKHWDQDIPVIRKTKFIKQKMGDENIYFFESDIKEMASGLPNIHRVLEGANGEFTDNQEDYFYEIDIKIKFVDDLKLDQSLKEKICFIDLPGFGTNNAFEENEVYTNLMKSCNIFLFVVFNLKIKETDNKKMLDNLYHQMKTYRGIPSEAFIKKCLFIINCDRDQDTTEKSIIQAKNDIISVVNGLNPSIFKDINVCFFNAKYYENYIYKSRYYNDGYSLIEYEYNEYLLLQEKLFRGLLDKIKGGTFNKYLNDILKDNIKNDIPDKFNDKLVEPNLSIKESVEKIIKDYSLKFKEKELDLIVKYITFGKQNLCNSDLLKKSNIDVFTRDLLISIGNAKKKEEEEINSNLKKCLKILDDVFEVDPDTKYGKCRDAPIAKVVKPHVEEDLNNMKAEINNYLNLIKNEFSNNDIISILDTCSLNIANVLQDQKNKIVSNLKNKNWESIQKEFEEIFEKETKELKNKLISTLDKASSNIKKKYDNCYRILNRFYAKRCEGKIIEYKNYISNNLGGNNNIESTINQIINDIISGSKTAADWDKVDGFFSWLGGKIFDDNYLKKIIDYILSHATPEIKKFADNIKSHVEKYKKDINDEIESSKNRVVEEME